MNMERCLALLAVLVPLIWVTWVDSAFGITLVVVLVLSVFLNVLLLFYCRHLKGKETQSKTSRIGNDPLKTAALNTEMGTEEQLVLANVNTESLTNTQEEPRTPAENERVRGYYEEIRSFSITSQEIYQDLDPESRVEKSPEQNYKLHEPGCNYEQLQQIYSFSVYQTLETDLGEDQEKGNIN